LSSINIFIPGVVLRIWFVRYGTLPTFYLWRSQ
jgi:hypothetical protein